MTDLLLLGETIKREQNNEILQIIDLCINASWIRSYYSDDIALCS